VNFSIDNYFFRDQRNAILNSGGGTADGDVKKSFQDIGRLIGKRWREIQPGESTNDLYDL
jgi:hypothetical protein